MKIYRCVKCRIETKKIPKFKKGECKEGIQHYFEEVIENERHNYRTSN